MFYVLGPWPQVQRRWSGGQPARRRSAMSSLGPDRPCEARPLVAPGREFFCGWGAAFINITITFPINKVMFRQMLHGVSMWSALGQLRGEGMFFLYRGILPPLFQKTVSVSLMFGMYDQYQRTLRRSAPRLHPVLADMSAAALAGASEALLTPFERLQILMQDRHYHERFANTWHAARQLRTFGLAEYYRGLVPILLRNSASNVLFFGLRERLKAAAPHDGGRASSAAWDFACGALIGAFISTVMYPLNVVKTHMQSRVGGPFAGVLATTAELYRARGRSVRALFRGVHINYTRSLISWGIINSTYELLRSHFV
ncbi:mitochondrial nicotinamide adenine dinucleotide transporter SLC25A51-like isoform X2 [Amphibalanus amphitrite]|uniref:mitochondrial nicotinamide adenine dinucleotide transporter SLC25A51-like isoform X2 n=1 Tax=Amphibalanus amphitrite TaxID=1232801 RepID=UPI001C92018D|nr:mitochondrial nicotinamide adenine dinucleotide transporter SLC25A51-like isoform X2 [Amphibalanus amphitrite]